MKPAEKIYNAKSKKFLLRICRLYELDCESLTKLEIIQKLVKRNKEEFDRAWKKIISKGWSTERKEIAEQAYWIVRAHIEFNTTIKKINEEN